MRRRWPERGCLVIAGLLLLGGCATAPGAHRPAAWPVSRLEASALLADGQAGPRLQVLVAYGGLVSSHTAVRLVDGAGQVVFWDPAGDYGRNGLDLAPRWGPYAQGVLRARDLILGDPPDLATYLRFRWGLDDVGVEVFEWELAEDAARELRGVLLGEPAPGRPRFSTVSPPAFCTVVTAEFLRRFAPLPRRLEGWYFFPASLAEALYAQSPVRVMLFRPDGHAEQYAPARPAGGGAEAAGRAPPARP